jgi:hypothetical protein
MNSYVYRMIRVYLYLVLELGIGKVNINYNKLVQNGIRNVQIPVFLYLIKA